jgi:excisionase family DNA binding protein
MALPKDLIDASAAALRLGVSRQTVNRWLNEGRLRGFKPAGRWRVSLSDLMRFAEAGCNLAPGQEPRGRARRGDPLAALRARGYAV